MEFTGRLTADADVRKTKGNKEFVTFNVAINDYYKKRDGEKVEHTDYFNCTYFLTTKIADSLLKGSIVTVTGRVYLNEYTGNDGKSHASIACHASNVKIVLKFKPTGNGAAAATNAPKPQADPTGGSKDKDDLPF